MTPNGLSVRSRTLLISPRSPVYNSLGAAFTAGPLAYFPTEEITRESASTWVNPGFDVYLEDPGIGLEYVAYTNGVGFGRVRLLDEEQSTELVNRPDLTGGFNPDLDAQKTLGIEGGIRLRSDANHVSADIAVYRLEISDRLVAFQTEEGGERTFFRNGGKNIHSGIEAALVWDPVPYIRINASGSKGSFEFQEEDLKGNTPETPDRRSTRSSSPDS